MDDCQVGFLGRIGFVGLEALVECPSITQTQVDTYIHMHGWLQWTEVKSAQESVFDFIRIFLPEWLM